MDLAKKLELLKQQKRIAEVNYQRITGAVGIIEELMKEQQSDKQSKKRSK